MFYANDSSLKYYHFILPHSIKRQFSELIHCDQCGYMSTQKCKREVQKRAWWHKWQTGVDLFIRCCEKCSAYHRSNAPNEAYCRQWYLMKLPVGGQLTCVVISGRLRTHQYIITAIDPFSKYAIALPLRCKRTQVVARIIVEWLLLIRSLPCEILADNGGELSNEISDELYKILGIHRLRTTARKASTNGCVERQHTTLNYILAKVVNEAHSDWSSLIPYAVFTYIAMVHAATGLSPFYVMFGRQPSWNINFLLHSKENKLQSVPQYTADVIDRLWLANQIVRKNLGAEAAYMSQWYDKRVKVAQSSVGDEVRAFNDMVRPG